MIPETITYEEAEKRYKCDRQSVRKAVLEGKITAYRPGKCVLIVLEEADAWWFSTKQKPLPHRGRPRGRRYR